MHSPRPRYCLDRLLLSLLNLAAIFGLVLVSAEARADLDYFVDADVGGFVPDSSTQAFRDAINNAPTEHISFSSDRDGGDYPENFDGTVDGSSFSYLLVLSSPGEELPDEVQLSLSPTSDAEVGRTPAFNGTLEIQFENASATAVGIGLKGFGLEDTITVFDTEGEMLADPRQGVSNNVFTFLGFTTQMDDRIQRVVLAGALFSLQDVQFVPEPGAGAQALAVVSVLAALRLGASSRRFSRLPR